MTTPLPHSPLSPLAIFEALEAAGDCALEGLNGLGELGAALLDASETLSEGLPGLLSDTMDSILPPAPLDDGAGTPPVSSPLPLG